MRERSLAVWRREAIRRMERSRRATLSFFARVPEQEILRPRTQGRWSVKDVFTHILAWEEEGAHRLDLIARGSGDRIRFYDDLRAADRFNARAVAAARATPLSAIVRRAARARRRLINALRQLPPGALQDASHRVPVVEWLAEFAWAHERDHLREIRVWWKMRRGAGNRRASSSRSVKRRKAV